MRDFLFENGKNWEIFFIYVKKELNSSVSVYLDLTEPKRNETNRNETTEIPKLFRFGRPLSKGVVEVL